MDKYINFFSNMIKNKYNVMFVDNFKIENENEFRIFTSSVGCIFTGTIKTTDNNIVAIVLVPSSYSSMYVSELLEYEHVNNCLSCRSIFDNCHSRYISKHSSQFRNRFYNQHKLLFESVFN